MSPDLRSATRDAVRGLLDLGPIVYLIWWAGLVVVFAGMTIAREIFGSIHSSTWQWASTAPKVMLLLVGLLLVTAVLPRWVSHGISRRAFSLAAGVVTTGAALVGAVFIAAGFAVESLVYGATGWQQVIDSPHLFTSPDQWHLIIVEHVLLFMAWSATGWLAGAGYYRWDWWRGTLFGVAAALPLLIAEAIASTGSPGTALPALLGVERFPLPLVMSGLVAVVIAGLVAAYHVVKNMALRIPGGWTA